VLLVPRTAGIIVKLVAFSRCANWRYEKVHTEHDHNRIQFRHQFSHEHALAFTLVTSASSKASPPPIQHTNNLPTSTLHGSYAPCPRSLSRMMNRLSSFLRLPIVAQPEVILLPHPQGHLLRGEASRHSHPKARLPLLHSVALA
jgi:hypothetical protein